MAKIKAVEFTCGSCQARNRLPLKRVLNLKKSPECGSCQKPLLRNFAKPFKNLDAKSYIHPLDDETLTSLKRIPGINTLLRNLIRHSFELATRLHHQSNFIRVGENQLPKLWEQFKHAHEQLGMGYLPELYVYQNPAPNAYTFGVQKSFVAISTGLLDLLDDEEILSVLAHELGHVQADHVLYKSATRIFGSLASTIAQATFGLGNLVIYPIQAALMRWDRASELSSDRASLLVVKNPAVVLSALMKLAGGSNKFKDQLNIEQFIDQAESFEEMQDEGPLGRYYAQFDSLFRTHPYPIWRAKELMEWVSSGNFLEMLDGDYQKATLTPMKTCSECGKEMKTNASVCPHCGASDEGSNGDDPIKKTMKDVQDWYNRNFRP